MGFASMVKGKIWKMTDKVALSSPIPFQSTDEEDNHQYPILFDEHLEREGIW